MPLGSPIGSGQGLKNLSNLQIIIENANVPVIVDAGIGAPSEATMAMELGADGILMNTAIAQAKNPEQMALCNEIRSSIGTFRLFSWSNGKNIMQLLVHQLVRLVSYNKVQNRLTN
jgi:thiazole synthase